MHTALKFSAVFQYGVWETTYSCGASADQSRFSNFEFVEMNEDMAESNGEDLLKLEFTEEVGEQGNQSLNFRLRDGGGGLDIELWGYAKLNGSDDLLKEEEKLLLGIVESDSEDEGVEEVEEAGKDKQAGEDK